MEKTEIPLPAIDPQTPDWDLISDMGGSWRESARHTLRALSAVDMSSESIGMEA